jgi:hypothetical protein
MTLQHSVGMGEPQALEISAHGAPRPVQSMELMSRCQDRKLQGSPIAERRE